MNKRSGSNQAAKEGRGQPLSRQQAAKVLGVTSGTLAVWACEGRYSLPFAKIGGKPVYFERDIDEFIERSMVRNISFEA